MKVLLSVLALFTATAGLAQSYEYGKPGELKGLKKIFIEAGTDANARNTIADIIEKAKVPDLEVLDSADGAEVILAFSGNKTKRVSGSTITAYGAQLNFQNVSVGTGVVYVFGKKPRNLRVLMTVEGTKDTIWKSSPATKFAKKFVSAYNMANGLK